MERRGIRSILMRGPAIAQWLYDEGERSYYDADLLVEPAAIASAEEALIALGFRGRSLLAGGYGPPVHAELWLRGEDPPIDLHRTIIGVEASDRELWNALAERTQSVALQGADVKILDLVGLLLVVTLHAAQHGFEAATHDVAVALQRVTIADWEQSSALAARVRAIAAFDAGLRTLPAGREVADRLGLAAEPSPETLLRAVVAPDLALGLNWVMELRSGRARARFILSKLFPSADQIRSRSSRARRGRLGLASAYVARIFWLISRAPRALGAVRHARRRARERSAR